MSEKVKDSQSM